MESMKRTAKYVNKIAEILNTSPQAQKLMDELQQEAIKNNCTVEQWEKIKMGLLEHLFYMAAQNIPEIKKDLAADVYELFNK